MDLYAQLTLVGLIIIFVIGISIYFSKSKKGNDLDSILDEIPGEFNVIKSVTVGGGSVGKSFINAVLLGKAGVFLILYSDLRGQIQGVEHSDKVKQVLGKTGVAVPNPVSEVVKIEHLFHEKMSIDYKYLKPIVVFDRQTDIRFDSCNVSTIHMQDLPQEVASYEGEEIPDDILIDIKKSFHIK